MNQQDIPSSDSQTAQEVRHMSVLLEQVISQNQLVLEAVSDMQTKVKLIPTMAEDIATLKADMKTVKAATTDLTHEVRTLDERVTRLEANT